MPKQQSSLDSFFNTGTKPKKQKTIQSFFNKSKENNSKEEDNAKTDPKVRDNVLNDDDDDDDDDDEPSPILSNSKGLSSKTTEITKTGQISKRRVIVDDDDSSADEQESPTPTTTTSKVLPKPQEVKTKASTTTDIVVTERLTTTTFDKSKPLVPAPLSKSSTKSTNDVKQQNKNKEIVQSNPNNDNNQTPPPTPAMLKLLARAKQLSQQAKVPSSEKLEPIVSPAMYQDLVQVLEQIEAISGRLEIQALLTLFFRRLLQYSPQDLYPAVYLASNSIAPAYQCVELGIGDSILMKAIGEAYGTKPSFVKERYEAEGDLGSVAKVFKGKQRTLSFGIKPKPLTVALVLKTFREIANISGSQSQKLKVDLIKKMLVATQQPTETKYIIRGLQGKLRIGLAQSTVLISLAHALTFTIPSTIQEDKVKLADIKEVDNDDNAKDNDDDDDDGKAPIEKKLEAAVNMVKQVYSEVPSYDALLDAALKVPLHALHDACSFQPGIPVVPMLAKPTKSAQEVLKRLDGLAFTCEYKYDGERAQIHKTASGELKVFSRNLLETSSKYPEVPLFVQEAAQASANGMAASFVLDAEVVAYNPQTEKFVPFQVLSTRKKTEESAATAKVQVIVQAFDLMYLNGKSLLGKRLEERRALMKQHFVPISGKFQYATSLDFVEDGDTIALEQFLDAAVKGQCEGLMVKTMNDVYEPSRRSLNWLKLKKDYLDGVGDSFDLVPLGAYYGKGKRTGVYGAYLLACYDPDREEFQSVCKIGTGFSDEDLQTLSASLNEHKLEMKSSQYNVSSSLECDVWFDAVQVWEVKAADLSKSSTHRGAVDKTGESDRGIGLRFPRFERVRDDKKPEQATSSDQVLEMYYNQDTVKGQDDGDDDDDGI